MKISKVKIRIDNNDGTFTEMESIIPHKIIAKIMSDIIDWKNTYMTTTKAVEEFQQAEIEMKKTVTP